MNADPNSTAALPLPGPGNFGGLLRKGTRSAVHLIPARTPGLLAHLSAMPVAVCVLLGAVSPAPGQAAKQAEKKDEAKKEDAKKDEAGKSKSSSRAVPRMLVPPTSPGQTRITWRNGEELRGELDSAGNGLVGWKTPLFSAPLMVKQEVIRRVDFTAGFQRAEGNFRLALVDGSHLTGELEKLDGETITFNSAACGVITVKREAAVAVERIAGEGVITAGPLALMPDRSASRSESGNPATPLFLAAGGRAASPGFNLSSQRTLDLPDKCISDLYIRTEGVPDFKFVLATGKEFTSVETWGDEVVLLLGDRFVSAGPKFKDSDRTAHIRVAWDRTAARVALYGGDGSLWAEISPEKKVEEPKKEAPKTEGNWLRRLFGGEEPVREQEVASRPAKPSKGITLHNKGSGIVVERFSVSEWNGDAPAPALADVAAVELGGEFISGEPATLTGDTLQVKTSGGQSRDVPLAQVRAIRWPRPIHSDRDNTRTDLWFSDGNLLRGKLLEARDGKATIETAFSAAPVTAALARGRAVILPEPDKKVEVVPLAKLDILRSGDTTLHGVIQAEGGDLPYFLPVGAEAPLAPVAATDLTMTRSLPPDEKFERAPALLHVKTNETLPVTLQNVTRDKVEFAWDAAEVHTLEIAKLHAVQFSAPANDGKGFDGAGWRSLSDDGKGISRKGDAVVLQPGGAGIAHPWILQGGDINFRMGQDDGRGLATIRIRLFCQGTERDSNSVNFLIGDFGGELYCGLERGEGQLTSSNQVTSNGEAANIRLTFPGNNVELWVNKVKVASTPANGGNAARIVNGALEGKVNPAAAPRNAKRTGTGMIIETASLWGNQQGSVKLMDLSMDTSPCMAGPPRFTEDARREALILPRLRREDPPRQVLIGRNGDLLRGEIEGITSTHLAFRSGLESFKVPVDRVAAAVWVIAPPKPEKEKEKPAPSPAPEEKKKPNPDEILAPDAADDDAFIVVKAPAAAGGEQTEKGNKPEAKKEEPKKEQPKPGLQWMDLTNGGRIALQVEAWNKDFITGQHPLLGKCRIPRNLVHHLTLKEPPPPAALTALSNWKLTPTADPVIPEDTGDSSPLAGKPAPAFKLPMLEGDDFEISAAKGKVVVLDFWATWCGPCVKSLPGLIEAMSEFPQDEVTFIAVNQGESKEQVKKFLEARQWKMPVGFDSDQKVGAKFKVEGIPHTVVIGRDGNIAFTKTGYEADGDKKIAEAVKKALEAPGPEKPKDTDKEKGKGKGREEESDPNNPLLPEPKGI